MRVLLASIAHFRDTPSGSARFVQDEATELVRRGDEVWVMAQGKPGQPEHEVREGVHLLRYVPAKTAPWNPARGFAHQRAARGLLGKYLPQVDAVHGHVPLPYLAALDFYPRTVHSCYTVHSPSVMEMAIVWRNSGLMRRLFAPAGLALINRIERQCLRRSQVVSALSNYTIRSLAKIHGNALTGSILKLPGWADTVRYVPVEDRIRAKTELGWPIERPVLFTLRRLVSRMGLNRLIDAAHQLRREGIAFHLMIGGGGPLREELEAQSKALGLSATITFLGRVADENLALAYAACDAFVLPTAALECFGLIAVEALSAGNPVLATPVGAIPEIIERVEPDWLSRSAETADITAMLRNFLTGKLPSHRPAELHEFAARNYSRDRLVPEFVEAMIGSGNPK